MQETNRNIAAGLKAYADFLEQHPAINAAPALTLYPVGDAKQLGVLLEACPNASFRVEQEHTICYMDVPFDGIRVEFVFNRDLVAIPTIQGGAVVWVLKPEIAQKLLSADEAVAA